MCDARVLAEVDGASFLRAVGRTHFREGDKLMRCHLREIINRSLASE